MTNPIDTGYLICASPRSGSTLLCDLLSRTDVAGRPASYFRPASVEGYAQRWGIDQSGPMWGAAYVDAVRAHGTDGTRCFGARIMGTDLPSVMARLRSLYPGRDGDAAMLRREFGIDVYVHLSREDRLAQAVSLVLAQQTGLWHRNADGSVRQGTAEGSTPVYDRSAIDAELRSLDHEAGIWAAWFEAADIEPLHVTYEQLAADPAGHAQRVLDALGREAIVPPPGTARLADSTNAEWTARHRAGTG